MAATVILMLMAFAQGPEILEVGKPIEQAIGNDAAVVHTPSLDANYTEAPTVGRTFMVVVPDSGAYTIDLRSFDFDSYLLVYEHNGPLIAEMDDGLVVPHSKLTVELSAQKEYQVYACALHGYRGNFTLSLIAGAPEPLTPVELNLAIEADCIGRMEYWGSTRGKDSFDYSFTLEQLGNHYFQNGKYSKTAALWEESLAIGEKLLGSDDPDVLFSMKNLGVCYYYLEEYEKAFAVMERSLKGMELALGVDHPDYFIVLTNLELMYTAIADFESGLPLKQQILKIRENELGAKHATIAELVANLGECQETLGHYDQALVSFERALAIREEVLGPDHEDTAFTLNSIGLVLGKLEDHGKALAFHRRALAVGVKALGELHPHAITYLENIALDFYNLGQHEEALSHYLQAVALREKSEGPDALATGKSMSGVAAAYGDLGRYNECFSTYRQCLPILENHLDPEDLLLGRRLGTYAHHLSNAGRYLDAQPLFLRSLVIHQKQLGEEHAQTANAHASVGNNLSELGKYGEARPYYEQSLAISEKQLGPFHPKTGTSVSLLGINLQNQGIFDDALPYFERSLAIDRHVFGENHLDVAESLSNLGALYQNMGRYREAQEKIEQALKIRESVFGPDDPESYIPLGNLATAFHNQKKYDEAEKAYLKSIALREQAVGPMDFSLATAIGNLGALYHEQKRYEEAISYYENALNLKKKAFGEVHPETFNSQNNYAILLYTMGDYQKALPIFESLMSNSLSYLDREYIFMSEAGRLSLLETLSNPGNFLACLGRVKEPDLRHSYAQFIQWKGKATRMQTNSVQLAHSSRGEKMEVGKSRLQGVSKRLAQLILLPSEDQAIDHAKQIESLRSERLRLERELVLDLGMNPKLEPVEIDELQNHLPPDAAVIDFFIDQFVHAWVLLPAGNPVLIKLGRAEELRKVQERFLSTTAVRGGRAIQENESKPAEELYSLLWKPLRAQIGDATKIFISADSFLCELPFGILETGEGKYLLEDFRFRYLSDALQVTVANDESAIAEGSILAIGAVNYFRRAEAQTVEVSVSPYSTRSRVGSSWSSLPATRDEMQSLRDLHDFVLEWQSPITMVEGKEATEERVRAELAGKRYVHIATHGYFEPDHLPSLLLDAAEKQAEVQIGEQIQAVGMLPGLLSGLVFAGVNDDPDPTRDDGYLSAEEIQLLDLSACDLVVLSACETALGSARAGEGLMSLRRSFAVAGADTVISSLWKVDDVATAQLMKDFYTNLWEKGMSRGEALHKAKLRMLRRNRIDNAGDALPSTWGAFVLSGEWN